MKTPINRRVQYVPRAPRPDMEAKRDAARKAMEENQLDELARAASVRAYRMRRPDLERILGGFNETMIDALRARHARIRR